MVGFGKQTQHLEDKYGSSMSWKAIENAINILLFIVLNPKDVHIYTIIFKKFNVFIYFYFFLCWVFVAARGLSLVVMSGG